MLGEEKAGNVKVVCRFRPLNEREKALSNSTVQDILNDQTVSIRDNKNGSTEPLNFSFDRVFDMNSTQNEVYSYAASSVIDSVIEGFNGTIFAYGQTSSGKTHTMEGEIAQKLTDQSGIIPRMVVQVFESISKCSENVQFRIKVSLVELYMEKLRDLIDTSKSDLKIRSDKKRGIFIENLTESYISSAEEVYGLMETARSTRAIAATNMNERSSRSHLLFILTISQNNMDDLSAKTGKLYLVDLAGSEKVGKTGAQGKVLDEAKKINVSLTALGKVINALTDGKSTHVPYRDSKLTRVLQESLGGNSKTTLIVTCSPHPNNIAETISTLRFGVSAKKIKNKPKINKEMTVAELQNLLEKSEKEAADKQMYIEQLKNHILVDLKQKSVPAFSSESNKLQPSAEEEVDLVGQLERQLEIQRNLNLVQEEELNSIKDKLEKLANEKQAFQQELVSLRASLKSNQPKSVERVSKILEQSDILDNDVKSLSVEKLLYDIQCITEDDRVISYLQQKRNMKLENTFDQTAYNQLLEDYEAEKQKRVQSEQKIDRNEKLMQKKLSQLENNICQLSHAYYDLLITQQRHKVDNIFLKKKLEEKDVSILSLKERIKDLQDQNRDLEDQRWDDEETTGKKVYSKYSITEEQQNKLNQLCEKKNLNVNSGANTKVVKVVRGGNK